MRHVLSHHCQTLRFFAAAVVLLVCFFQARPALALLNEGQFSEREKVGFAFYKLAQLPPDFKNWIQADAPADQAGKALTQDQVERLENGFSLYSPDEDMIQVETPATILFPTLTAEQAKPGFQGQKPIVISLGNMQMLYFPYQIGSDFWVAIVPSNEEQFHTLMVDSATYDKMIHALRVLGEHKGKAILKITLRPDHVDAQKPMMLGKQYMWLMMASVADYQIWDGKNTMPLWTYSAPWYVSNDSHDLLDLYGQ
jgi:hypothetical protein